MVARFPRHVSRQVLTLDGLWDFAFLGSTDPCSVEPRTVHFDDVMAVPGCFDATPKYAGKRGTAVYRTRLPAAWLALAPNERLRVQIGAAHHYCRTYLAGQFIGEHSTGFTSFHHDVSQAPTLSSHARQVESHANAFSSKQNGALATPRTSHADELVIVVDNAFSDRAPLHLEYFDWYHYGGLTRSVQLQRLVATSIESVKVHTLDADRQSLQVRVQYSNATCPKTVPFSILVNGSVVFSESVRLDEAEAELVRDIELPGTPLWTPETPTLHLLRVELGEDDWQQRIGIRQVQVRRGTLCLNGKPLQIRGMNRHEAHPGFGHSVPLSQQLADLQLLKDCGCNFVRGSHYPQDPNFLDLCDELGICVYSEAIGWQHTEEQLIAPHFVDAQSAHIREMVDAAYNHPSVIMWGILNESESASPACRNTFERLLSQVRLADPTRPVAFASNRHQRDICLDLCDVVCMNAYPGWYFETPDRIAAWLDQLFSELRQKVPDVPILISEIGAGALLGVRDANRQHWTEDYQAEVLQRVLAHLLASSTDCIGVCLWQFCDCRVGQNAEAAMRRPRGFNNKGIFDEFRRPKLARDVVRRCFRRASIKARSPRPDE